LLRLPEHISNSKDSGTKKSVTVGAGSMRPIISVATECREFGFASHPMKD
jgi:hypothetical protein